MLCALTVRNLKPGTMEQFRAAFIPDDDVEAPAGWKRFYALRNVGDENQVITFGFFDGTLDELRAGQQSGNAQYEQRRAAAEEFVESVGADGVFEVVEERSME
jgi:heme-degrading monooxygenase HmoA